MEGVSGYRSIMTSMRVPVQEIRSGKTKNVELLMNVQELVRMMGGARVTCCKSGKVPPL
jgi:hypothetical protein